MKDEDIRSAAERVRASIKEAIGKVTGDEQIEAEGAAEKTAEKPNPTDGETGNDENGSGT